MNNSKALGDHVFEFSYFKIKKMLKKKKIKIVVLLFANAPTITAKMIDKGIEILKKDKSAGTQLYQHRFTNESLESKKTG